MIKYLVSWQVTMLGAEKTTMRDTIERDSPITEECLDEIEDMAYEIWDDCSEAVLIAFSEVKG